MNAEKHEDEKKKLDETLKESFPASDPSSTNQSDPEPVRPIDRKPAHIDQNLVDKLAREAAEKMSQQ